MTPLYKITLDGSDITGNFNDRLLTLTATLHESGETNTLEIELDDRDSALAIPPKGRTLEVFLGYKETGIGSIGSFNIETVKLDWSPRKMMISGRSADLKSTGLKEHRDNNYENKSVSDIAGEIAGRNGLSLGVIGDIGGYTYKMLHQTGESDINLLTRIARENNAIFSIAGGKLMMSKRGDAQSLSGLLLSQEITPPDVTHVTVTLPDRGSFGKASADYFDFAKGKRVRVDSGEGEGPFVVKHALLDVENALKAAESRKNELDRSKAEVHVDLTRGNPNMTPSSNLTLSGFRDGINGTYNIQSVEHNLDSAGYITKIDGEKGGDDGDSADTPETPATPATPASPAAPVTPATPAAPAEPDDPEILPGP